VVMAETVEMAEQEMAETVEMAAVEVISRVMVLAVGVATAAIAEVMVSKVAAVVLTEETVVMEATAEVQAAAKQTTPTMGIVISNLIV